MSHQQTRGNTGGIGAGSRLAKLQAQFQQKQMQEREQKLLQMLDTQQQKALQKAALNGTIPPNKYSNGHSINNNVLNNNHVINHNFINTSAHTVLPPSVQSSPAPLSSNVTNLGNGKVRQMFEERRKGGGTVTIGAPTTISKSPSPSGSSSYSNGKIRSGIDKSYPLDPIDASRGKGRSSSSKSDPATVTTYSNSSSISRRVSGASNLRGATTTVKMPPAVTPDAGRASPSYRENSNIIPNTTKYSDFANLSNAEGNVGRERNLSSQMKRLNISERNSPSPDEMKSNRSTPTPFGGSTKPSNLNKSRAGVSTSGTRRPAPSSAKVSSMTPTRKTSGSVGKPPPERQGPVPPGMAECKVCSRRFAQDRIEKHEVICKKSSKKRKVFDPTKMRMKGTEAEPYLRIVSAKKTKPEPKAKKADWRKKHEEFIKTIRAAKQYQDHVAKGGNPADLPPPPPADTSDYIPCPYCGRKFNEAAADRHIPKCKNIKSNKR